MRRFHVVGDDGEVIAEGVMFTHGQAAVAWKAMISAVTLYPNLEALKIIHGGEGRAVFLE